jgi:hypothetical protein
MKEIDSYRESYEKIKMAGKDKSLVFPNWTIQLAKFVHSFTTKNR